MPNSNYISGRAFEYTVMKDFKAKGYEAMRTAGSHGLFDVIAIHKTLPSIELIQCKVVESEAVGTRFAKLWKDAPPFAPLLLPKGTHQVLAVKVKGKKEYEVTYV